MNDLKVHCIAVGDFEANCFVAWKDPDKAVIIDPGGEVETIAGFLQDRNLTPCAYLLTHGHVDHVSGISGLCERYPAWIGMHPADLLWAFKSSNAMPPFYSAPEIPRCDIQGIDDDQKLTLGNLVFRVLLTPGHSPGSVCFLVTAEHALFTGDTLFAGSVGRTDFAGGNPRAMTESLRRISQLPGETIIYPGHGPKSTIEDEKRTNFFLRNLGP